MDHFEFEDLISAYIENDLPLNKRKEIEAFLSKNPSQNQLIKKISHNIEALKRLPKITSKNNFNQKLMERIKSNNHDINSVVKRRANIFGFTFFNASVLLGLIVLLLILSYEFTGLTPSLKNNHSNQVSDNKKFLSKIDITEKNKKNNISNTNLTTFQSDTTKKEKVDFSKNIKYVTD